MGCDMRSLTDEEIVPMARRGDHEAITLLFTRHRRLLTAICIGVARSDGEDALQQVMMNLPERLGSFDPTCGTFRCWISRVARREALKMVTRRPRLDRDAVRIDADDRFERSSRVDCPERRVLGHAELGRLLDRLDARARYVVIAGCLGGEPDTVIAAELGVELVTVRTIRSKARAELVERVERRRELSATHLLELSV